MDFSGVEHSVTNSTEPRWGTIAQAADALAVNPKTIRRMISRGDIPARRVGSRMIRVDLAVLDHLGRPLAVKRET